MRYATLHGGKGVGVPTTYDCDCSLHGIERVTLRDRWQDTLNNNVDPRKSRFPITDTSLIVTLLSHVSRSRQFSAQRHQYARLTC